jgi:hypothetical protein
MSYAQQIATAKRLIGRKGTSVVVTRKHQGAKDELNGTRAAGGNKTGQFYVVGLPAGKSAETQIGSLVGRRLSMFYLAKISSAFDPEPGDQVPWGGKTWTVIWTASYDPDNSGNTIFTQAYGEIS